MSERYKFVEGHAHFITFAVVGWVDVFTRREYAEFLLENLAYCRKNKGLRLYDLVIMPDHLHLIAAAANGGLGEIMRDFKTFTSKELVKRIAANQRESRKEWMLRIFREHGAANPRNKDHQFWAPAPKPATVACTIASATERNRATVRSSWTSRNSSTSADATFVRIRYALAWSMRRAHTCGAALTRIWILSLMKDRKQTEDKEARAWTLAPVPGKWIALAHAEIVRIQRGQHAFLRSYAGTNEAEFFAVAVEYFFERPQEFQTALPELYGTLGGLLRQDPAVQVG